MLCAITNCKLDLLSEFYLEGGWSQKRLTAFWSNSFSLLAFSHFRVWCFFVVARVLRFSKGIGSGLLAFTARPKTECPASQPASQLKEGRAADQKDRVVFALSAIIGGIVAYQFPQKRTLLSMRGISVISHNTIIIFLKQGCKWWVGRVGNCPPRFWQIRRRRQAVATRRITTCPPRFRKLLTPL